MNTENENTPDLSNWQKAIEVLHDLGAQKLTMYSGAAHYRVATKHNVGLQVVRRCAKRHDPILQVIKSQADEIKALEKEIIRLKRRLGGQCALEPWEMTTDEFKAHLKATWIDPFADETVGFGSKEIDSPLCELK